MSRRTRWIIAVVVVLVVYGIAVLILWNSIQRPYERPSGHTPAEARIIEAAWKYHGKNITLITTPERIYFERGGRQITILWRG